MPPANNDITSTQAKQILAELQKLRQDIDRMNRNVEQSSQGKQRINPSSFSLSCRIDCAGLIHLRLENIGQIENKAW